ncbi:MAG: phage tail tape measure protein [Phycisphaerae bacterium]
MATEKREIVAVFSAENKARGAMAGFRSEMDKTGQAMKRMAVGALAAVGGLYALKRGVIDSIKEFASFEKQMAMVSTMLDDQAMHLMPQYTGQIRDMAKKFGEGTETMAKGLYDILSASIAPSKAMDVLRVSIKAAKAGMTDTGIAADAITTILNSYRWEAEQAAQISDKLFAIVKRGKTTFADLAPNIGKVAALAAQANLSFDELGAAIATLTRSGLQTELAMTGLRSIITQFLKPNKEASELARQYGFELNTATLEAIGLTGVMEKLKGITGEQLAVLMPNVRGMAGFAIAVNSASEMIKDYEFIMSSANQTQEAFNKMADTTSFKLDRLNQRWIQLKIAIGETVVNWWDAIAAAGARQEEQENVIKRAREEYRKFTGDIKAFTMKPAPIGAWAMPTMELPQYPAIYQGIMNQIIGGYKAMEQPLEVQKEALREIHEREKERAELIKAVETFEKQSAERLEQQRKISADINDQLQFERELMEGTVAGPLTEAAEKWEELLKAERAYAREFEREMEAAEAAPEALDKADQLADAYRDMRGEMGRMTKAVFAAEMKALMDLRDLYESYGVDVQTLTAWYEEQAEILKIDYLKAVGGLAGGFVAAGMQIKREMKTWGDIAYEFSMTLENSIARGIENTMRNFEDWKEHLLSMFEEIYWSAIRIAFIQPIAAGLAGAMTGAVGGLAGLLGGGGSSALAASRAGPPLELQTGGIVKSPRVGLVGEVPEAIVPLIGGRSIPVEMRGGGERSTKVEIYNPPGVPMKISKAEEYILSDERIIQVTMRAMGTDIQYRRSIAQASRS